ncbi:hypothetical protein DPMN_156583 [Dreissena polymorpha]|uniref:Uncharacterized protein n=1 Tax=Dreissena polymorpha TaxID=45954 RepID=A0A9D4FQZ1_DREPO|nr:hypothetical protein DPMN_156583 [Dreissena polymorpha]
MSRRPFSEANIRMRAADSLSKIRVFRYSSGNGIGMCDALLGSDEVSCHSLFLAILLMVPTVPAATLT